MADFSSWWMPAGAKTLNNGFVGYFNSPGITTNAGSMATGAAFGTKPNVVTSTPYTAPVPPVPAPAAPKPAAPKASTTTKAAAAPTSSYTDATAALPVSTAPIVETPPVVIPSAQSDAVYQAQMNGLAKAMADFQNEQLNAANQYGNTYSDSLRQLGWQVDPNAQGGGRFDPTNTQGYYGQAYNNTMDDFASRGLLNSGLLAQAQNNLATDFANRKVGFDTARNAFNTDQAQKLQAYQNENNTSQTQALLEAVARIAQKYNVDTSQVGR